MDALIIVVVLVHAAIYHTRGKNPRVFGSFLLWTVVLVLIETLPVSYELKMMLVLVFIGLLVAIRIKRKNR